MCVCVRVFVLCVCVCVCECVCVCACICVCLCRGGADNCIGASENSRWPNKICVALAFASSYLHQDSCVLAVGRHELLPDVV